MKTTQEVSTAAVTHKTNTAAEDLGRTTSKKDLGTSPLILEKIIINK